MPGAKPRRSLFSRLPVLVFALFALVSAAVGSQAATGGQQRNPGPADVDARLELRFGILAQLDGRYQQASQAFQQTIARAADPELIRQARIWLGRSYYSQGLWDAAVAEWRRAAGDSGVVLDLADTVDVRRGLIGDHLTGRYVRSGEFDGLQGGFNTVRRPTAVRARNDGSIYVASFGANEVSLLSINGEVTRRYLGGVEGLDGPWDARLHANGGLYVTEFNRDRISVFNDLGVRTAAFGSSGRAPGQLLGPQYLAFDQFGAVYVTEWANRRVSKFSADGSFLQTFPTQDDPRRRRPTGIVILGEEAWVGDAQNSAVVVYDLSGNYLRECELPDRSAPDGMTAHPDGSILLAMSGQLHRLDPLSCLVTPLLEPGEARVQHADLDPNGVLMAADVSGDQVVLYSESQRLAANLHVMVDHLVVQPDRVVQLRLSVEDRFGRPMVGLQERNFAISEAGASRESELVWAGWRDASVRAGFLRTPSDSIALNSALVGSWQQISEADPDARVWLSRSGTPPSPVTTPGTQVPVAALQQPGSPGPLDLLIRLAALEAAQREGRRSLVLVHDGAVPADAFDQVGLVEIGQLLRAQQIGLHVLTTEPDNLAGPIRYLVEISGGSVVDARPASAAATLTAALSRQLSGRYVLEFRSGVVPPPGQDYVPLAVNVTMTDTSGRDELGFHAALDF